MRELFRDRGEPGVCSIFGVDDVLMGAGILGDVGSALIGSSAAKKAAKNATATAQNNNALAQSNYAQDQALYQPYLATGINANNYINALLGLPSTGQTASSVTAQSNPNYASYVQNNPDLLAAFNSQQGLARGRTMEEFGRLHWTSQGNGEGRSYTPTGAAQAAQAPTDAQQGQNNTQAAQDAFKAYQDSTGHQFRLDTGVNALQSSAASRGLLKSGATLKGITQYGQNLGTQDFQNYLGNLVGQQNLGTGATSGLVNAGGNLYGQLSANNDSAASAQNASTIAGANVWTNALQGIAGGVGRAMGSSYGKSSSSSGPKTWSL